MKTISVRDLNRRTADIIDQVEEGQVFELRRKGKTVGFLTRICPPVETKKDDDNGWDAHFRWLRTQSKAEGKRLLKAFEEDRRRMREREEYLDSLVRKR